MRKQVLSVHWGNGLSNKISTIFINMLIVSLKELKRKIAINSLYLLMVQNDKRFLLSSYVCTIV